MTQHKVLKTTDGRRYKVRMSQEEVDARTIYRIALVTLPFISSALMFWLWIRIGG